MAEVLDIRTVEDRFGYQIANSRVRVTRILKDGYSLGLKPAEIVFNLRVSTMGIGVQAYYWSELLERAQFESRQSVPDSI